MIDIEKLINNVGIILRKTSLEDNLCGFIEYNNNTEKYTITINANHGFNRQRFTMAHEFAHFMLHDEIIKLRGQLDRDFASENISQEDKRLESQADSYGANILMPLDLINEIIRLNKYDINKPEDRRSIALQLGVSEVALGIQISDL